VLKSNLFAVVGLLCFALGLAAATGHVSCQSEGARPAASPPPPPMDAGILRSPMVTSLAPLAANAGAPVALATGEHSARHLFACDGGVFWVDGTASTRILQATPHTGGQPGHGSSATHVPAPIVRLTLDPATTGDPSAFAAPAEDHGSLYWFQPAPAGSSSAAPEGMIVKTRTSSWKASAIATVGRQASRTEAVFAGGHFAWLEDGGLFDVLVPSGPPRARFDSAKLTSLLADGQASDFHALTADAASLYVVGPADPTSGMGAPEAIWKIARDGATPGSDQPTLLFDAPDQTGARSDSEALHLAGSSVYWLDGAERLWLVPQASQAQATANAPSAGGPRLVATSVTSFGLDDADNPTTLYLVTGNAVAAVPLAAGLPAPAGSMLANGVQILELAATPDSVYWIDGGDDPARSSSVQMLPRS
jgi:hypothetical protein